MRKIPVSMQYLTSNLKLLFIFQSTSLMKSQKIIFSCKFTRRFSSLLSKDTHLIDMFQSLEYKIWPIYFNRSKNNLHQGPKYL